MKKLTQPLIWQYDPYFTSNWYSESLAQYHAVADSFARAKDNREDDKRYLAGEIKYQTLVANTKRRRLKAEKARSRT